MNLSPAWIARLAGLGFEAVHWSTIGAATAPDVEILAWANEHQFVVVTSDLDISAILAAGAGAAPSVVQIRMQDLIFDSAVANLDVRGPPPAPFPRRSAAIRDGVMPPGSATRAESPFAVSKICRTSGMLQTLCARRYRS